MYFDVTAYGYGVGLVMAGWVFGMVASIVFHTIRGVSRVI